jgi:hypothetical protein
MQETLQPLEEQKNNNALPEDEADEALWDAQFADSLDVLELLANEALAEHRTGKIGTLDSDGELKALSLQQEFMLLPFEERQRILAQQAQELVGHYEQTAAEWEEWEAGDFSDED